MSTNNQKLVKEILLRLSKIKKSISTSYKNGKTIQTSKTTEGNTFLDLQKAVYMIALNNNVFDTTEREKKEGEKAQIRAVCEAYDAPLKVADNLKDYSLDQQDAIIRYFTTGVGNILFTKKPLRLFDNKKEPNLTKWIALSVTLTPHEIQKGVKRLPMSVQKALLSALKEHVK